MMNAHTHPRAIPMGKTRSSAFHARFRTALAMLLFALGTIGSANRLQAQVDLYIGGDIVLSGIGDTLYAQGNILYNAGSGKMNQVISSALYFTGNFHNNNLTQLPFYADPNPLLRSRGNVFADQGFAQTIGGIGKINFYSLAINKVLSTQNVALTNDITLFNKLYMLNGDLNVANARVIFNNKDTASTIVGETDANRIHGGTGYLQVKRFCNSAPISPARLGLSFNGLQDSVLIRRYFQSQASVVDGSIERWYEVRNANGSIQFAQVSSNYLDSTETNGHGQEPRYRVFKTTDNGSTWGRLNSTVDTALNVATAPVMAGITADTLRYTIADFECANPPADSLPADTAFCQGDSVQLNAGSGPGYTYLWSTGATSQHIWASATDSIWVEKFDLRGCSNRDTIIVTEHSLPFVSLALGQDTVSECPGINLNLDAGNPGMNYLWSTSATTQVIALSHNSTSIDLDTVWVLVSDINGCSNNDSVIFKHLPAPVVNLGATQSICGGANAVLNAALSGPAGNVGVSYLWNTGFSSASITVGVSGQYHVTVTNAYTCTASDTVQVNVAPAISASATPTNISCNGGGNGSISLTVTGGSPAFSYLWSNGATTQNLNALVPGTYTVTVTDALACTAITSTPVTQPAALVNSMSSTNISCFGGSDGTASINVSGGTFPYSYAWSNGSTSNALSTLTAGVYSVTATDANGCTTTGARTITEPALLSLSLNNLQDVGCNGGSNGAIDVNVAGGTGTYTYIWSNGANTQDLSGLTAGSYAITVTDANGCTANMAFTVAEPSPITASSISTDVNCSGGSDGTIDLTVGGGTAAYSFQWSNAATTEDLIGIPAGSYTVTITDANNCTLTLSDTLAQPVAIALSAQGYDANCNQSDGAAAVQASGGSGILSYLWSTSATTDSISGIPAGVYSVTVTDQNGCLDSISISVNNIGAGSVSLDSAHNVSCFGGTDGFISVIMSGGAGPFTYTWSNGGSADILSGIPFGTYNLTVTDQSGCIATFTHTLSQPPVLGSAGIVTDASCGGALDGAIDFIPSGGTLPYSFAWSNASSTEDLSAIGAGSYVVSLTDFNGCTLSDTFSVAEPSTLTLSHTSTDVSCAGGNNGAVDLSVAGGSPTYSFAWSNGQISEDANGLIAGTYIVTVTDQNGCLGTDTTVIVEPSAIGLSVDTTNISCNGGSDGALDLSASGGTLPYSFLWSNSITTEDLSGLSSGIFDVTLTDANGCTSTASGSVTEPSLLTMALSATDVHCGGASSGTAMAIGSGGTGSYQFLWSNGDTTSTVTGLVAGNYQVTLTDANGCTVNGQTTVIEPPTLSFANTTVPVTCRDQADGAIFITPFGGSTPYTYAWSNGATTQNLIGVVAAEYILTMTDSAGCIFRDTLEVLEGDSALEARFLAASIVNSEDTVYFLEFSTPLPDSIRWDFGDGGSSTASYPYHVFADNLSEDTSYYQVKLFVSNAWCSDSVIKTITVVNGSGKVNQGPGQNGVGDIVNMLVFPNPNQGQFEVQLQLMQKMDADFRLYDLHGRTVARQRRSGDSNYTVSFGMNGQLAQGVYLLSVQAKESQKIIRVVIF